MFNTGRSLETLLSGSLTDFRKQTHPEEKSEAFQELQREKERVIGRGIDQIRRIKTAIFDCTDPDSQQRFMKMGVTLADHLADYCLADSKDRTAPLKEHTYHEELRKLSEALENLEPLSKHFIVPTYVAQHLRRAAGDLLIRVEEKVGSLMSPSKPLSEEEMRGVLVEFIRGVNCLSRNAEDVLFSPTTTIAGIMSGGLVYPLMAKKIAERYGDNGANTLTVIGVAVDGESKRVVFERVSNEDKVKHLIIVDDMIDKGGTVLAAANGAEDVFTGATIYNGVGAASYPTGRIPPTQKKHMNHLGRVFQDFADLTESGRLEEARVVLIEACAYAQENGVKLLPGWHKRAARYFKDSASLLGEGLSE